MPHAHDEAPAPAVQAPEVPAPENPEPRDGRPHVVVVGAGFAGFFCARRLEKTLDDSEARITVISATDHLCYSPLLPEVAAGRLEPRRCAVPLHSSFGRSRVVQGVVTEVDLDGRTVSVTRAHQEPEELSWDRLVLTVGSVTRTFDTPGMLENARGLKNLAEAAYLRDHVLRQLEIADATDDLDERRARCTFLTVGAGYAGTETAAQLQLLTHQSIDNFPRLTMADLHWVLMDAAEKVLPELGDNLGKRALDMVQDRGMDVRLGVTLKEIRDDGVTFDDGTELATHTVIWAAGVAAAPLVGELGLPTTKGRLDVDASLRLVGRDDVFAAGDAAAVPGPHQGRPGRRLLPPVPADRAARPAPGRGDGAQRRREPGQRGAQGLHPPRPRARGRHGGQRVGGQAAGGGAVGPGGQGRHQGLPPVRPALGGRTSAHRGGLGGGPGVPPAGDADGLRGRGPGVAGDRGAALRQLNGGSGARGVREVTEEQPGRSCADAVDQGQSSHDARGPPPARGMTGAPHTKRYYPALDGLRAAAVLAVIGYHGWKYVTPGGFLGVDVFFVISGFVITLTLLREHGRTGRIALVDFWRRRFWRLMPAMVAAVALAAVCNLLVRSTGVRSFAEQTLFTLTYTYNLGQYAQDRGGGQILSHMWSLGVEEQFYLFWAPLLAVLLGVAVTRRDRVRAVALVLAVFLAARLATGAFLGEIAAFYLPWARFHQLVIGALLAVVLHGKTPGRLERAAAMPSVALAALVPLLVFSLVVEDLRATWLMFGGTTLVALLSAVLVAHTYVDTRSVLRDVLSWAPVVWVGQRSYGIYVFHYPVEVTLRQTSLPDVWTVPVMLAIVLPLSAASYRWLETPLRRRGHATPQEALPTARADQPSRVR